MMLAACTCSGGSATRWMATTSAVNGHVCAPSHMVIDCRNSNPHKLEGPLDRPDGQVDGAVLLADGVDQLADHVEDGAAGFLQPLVAPPPPSPSAVKREVRSDFAAHIHLRLRWGADELEDYCAFLQ